MQRFLPVLTLALLAVAIPEVLFGATPLTEPGRILATLPIYAGGAIVVRELARRCRVGWIGIAALGVAYGIVEEGLALGSIFNPDLFNAALVGGRLLGVNWTWTEWTLGYHAVWSITIPILLTELAFPARRTQPWLGNTGLAIAGLVYLAGVVFMTLIFRLAVAPEYAPPLVLYVAAGLIAVGIAMAALRWPRLGSSQRPPPPATVPAPWMAGLLSLMMAAVWFALLLLPAPIKTGGWVVVPMVLAAALLVGTVLLVRHWSAGLHEWTDLHRLALAVGPLPVHVWYGLTYVTRGSPVDRLGEAAAAVVVALLLVLLGQRLRARGTAAGPSGPHTASGAVTASH